MRHLHIPARCTAYFLSNVDDGQKGNEGFRIADSVELSLCAARFLPTATVLFQTHVQLLPVRGGGPPGAPGIAAEHSSCLITAAVIPRGALHALLCRFNALHFMLTRAVAWRGFAACVERSIPMCLCLGELVFPSGYLLVPLA
jgi:hypothetical protein